MLPFTLYKQWSDQRLAASQDFVRRAHRLSQLPLAGEPAVAQTPADVVYTENKLRLLRYRPLSGYTGRRYPVPLLVVPSFINRYYVLDLQPGRSLVEYMRDSGFDVWMIDWGTPGSEDRFVTFDDYVDRYLANCVDTIRAATNQPRVALLGYCIGGVLTTVFTALHGPWVHSLANLAAPIDFHDEGMLSQWARREHFPVDLVVDTYGNMPAWLLQTSFKWLRPVGEVRNAWTLWDRLDDPERLEDLLALRRWVEDAVSVPGEAYRKFVRDCYQDNLLVHNRLQINGRRVDLGSISCPLLNITAADDHICPSPSAVILNRLVASRDVTQLTLQGGHVGAVVGRAATDVLWPRLREWLAGRIRDSWPSATMSR